MGKDKRIDIGSIHIEKSVIEDIIFNAVNDIEGVRLCPPNMISLTIGLLRKSKYPSIKLKIDANQDLSLDIDIIVQYGEHLPKTAEKVQSHVKLCVEKAVDVKVKDVSVNIQKVDRR